MGRSKRRARHEAAPAREGEPTKHVEKMEHHPFHAALAGVKAAPARRPEAPKVARKPPPDVIRRPARPEERLVRHDYDDRMAFREAFAGVRPLGQAPGKAPGKKAPPRKKAPPTRIEPQKREEADEEVRARLDALVAGGVRFEVQRGGDGEVRGRQKGAHASHLAHLGAGFVPQATLDLHGLRAEAAARAVVSFVRDSWRQGKRQVLIIHGRGSGSAAGVPVLKEVVVDSLTASGASSVVLAFASAPRSLGGVGALAVRLGER